jgi:hypothetical protein
VAAAGEGEGFALWYALPLFAFVLLAMAASYVMTQGRAGSRCFNRSSGRR